MSIEELKIKVISEIRSARSEYKEKFDQHPDSYQHIRKINELIDLYN